MDNFINRNKRDIVRRAISFFISGSCKPKNADCTSKSAQKDLFSISKCANISLADRQLYVHCGHLLTNVRWRDTWLREQVIL